MLLSLLNDWISPSYTDPIDGQTESPLQLTDASTTAPGPSLIHTLPPHNLGVIVLNTESVRLWEC